MSRTDIESTLHYKDNVKKSKTVHSFGDNSYSPKNHLSNRKKSNRPIIANLDKRAIEAEQANTTNQSSTFKDHAHKLTHCSCYMAGRELPTKEVIRVGQNNCKSRFCLVCNARLSSKRRNSVMQYLSENSDEYKEYIPYMLTLTLQHDQHTRNYDYTPELLDNFNWLRRKNKKNKMFWDEHIAGGFYSVEITHKNDSPHIHLHVFILAKDTLPNSFLKQIKSRWSKKTGGSNQVDLTRGYYKQNDQKLFYKKGDSIEFLSKVIAETTKYTIKIESKDFERVSNDTLYSIATTRKRYFGFFGCMYAKGITNYDLSSLTDVEETDNKLYSPTTGEGFTKGQTRLAMTHFNNTIEHSAILEGETNALRHYYTFKDARFVKYCTTAQEAGKELALHTKYTLPTRQQTIDKTSNEIPLDTIDLTVTVLPDTKPTETIQTTDFETRKREKHKRLIDLAASNRVNIVIDCNEYEIPSTFTDDVDLIEQYVFDWYGGLEDKYICVVKVGNSRIKTTTNNVMELVMELDENKRGWYFVNIHERYLDDNEVWKVQQVANYTQKYRPTETEPTTEDLRRLKWSLEGRKDGNITGKAYRELN